MAKGEQQARKKRKSVDKAQGKQKKRQLDEEQPAEQPAAPRHVDVGPSGWEELEQPQDVQQQAEPQAQQQVEPRKLSKLQKRRVKEDRERAIREAEMKKLEAETAPDSEVEFEQLLLSAPNSSFVWIKYLAFLVSLGEMERARQLAERALASIHYREEQEKFNVWVAWLNMENLYGSEEATLALLSKALAHTDARRMYLAAVDIFDRTQKDNLVEQCLKAMTRKFNENPDVWLRAVKFRLSREDGEGARKTLDRSLQSLPKFEHVRMISQTGLLEFKLGDEERGRSLFEGVLRNYPKRLDLWSVYLDQEVAAGDQQRIRALFERATHLELPPKKMKFLFKRYLDYEKKHGDAASVEHVKRRAMEYVEAQAAA
ncbi:RNA binding rRNA processing [Chlorella sorokiniana]|uniref:RNA binding rRNA processing n=1 Tax=Chlorella sorokiniana TaxID=3076 RepID=A0A2P6TPN0_CHLSO|nr:RNA binding rRNA processing [Chlorella sorokiniana]|eukprot:PRW55969.1 RNA binding rRNA processing [Chlorella sorokiniana]